MNPGMAVQPMVGSVFTRHADPVTCSTAVYPEVANVVRNASVSQDTNAPVRTVASLRREDVEVNTGVRSAAEVNAPIETESSRFEPLIKTAPQATRSETPPPHQAATEIPVETTEPEPRTDSRLVEREVVLERRELALRDRLVAVAPVQP